MTYPFILYLIFLSFSMINSNETYRQQTSSFDESLCSNCRVTKKSERVIDGYEIPKNQVVYLASIFIETKERLENSSQIKLTYKAVCTGIILNEYWVLSALYCSDELFKDDVRGFVAAGSDHSIEKTWFFNKYRSVIEKQVKPSFLANKNTNDLVLYKLKTPFVLGNSTNIYPACFLRKKIDKFRFYLMSAGYGGTDEEKMTTEKYKTNDNEKRSIFRETYEKNNITIITRAHKPLMSIFEENDENCTEKFICVQSINGVMCGEDAGAPLVSYLPEYQASFIFGVSDGFEMIKDTNKSNSTHDVWINCKFNKANRFIRVSNYLDNFIIERIGTNRMCLTNEDATILPEPTKSRREADFKIEFRKILGFFFIFVAILIVFFCSIKKTINLKTQESLIDKSVRSLKNNKSIKSIKSTKSIKSVKSIKSLKIKKDEILKKGSQIGE